MSLELKRFNPKNIEDNGVCVFIGKRRTGKTTLVTDILYHKRNLPAGIVMSGTEEGNSYYQQYIPDSFVYNEYKSDTIEKVIERQKRQLRKKDADPNLFILIDDCMYDKKMIRDKNMRTIFMNGRHWKIFFMLTMQYCMDLSPDLRSNVDYVFVLRENIIQNREKIYKNFFGIFPTFDMFTQVMDQCTENYECLVLDNTSKSNKIEDVVFWYKAKQHEKGTFRVGSNSFWNCHKKNYNPNHFNKPSTAITKGSKVTIKKKS